MATYVMGMALYDLDTEADVISQKRDANGN